jgi:hypothetical protein
MKTLSALAFAASISIPCVASAQMRPIDGPKVIRDYVDGDAIPPGYHPQSRPRVGLAVAGAAIFGGTYFFTAVGGGAALQQDKNEGSHTSDAVLFIPVAGPFIRAIDNDSLSSLLLVVDGLLQTAGAAMLLGGFLATKTVLVRDDYAKRTIIPMPIVFANGAGAGVVGRF